jgi:hypothetical protein
MSFYPEDKEVPKELVFDDIRIRQLRATDNELDYKAVIESGFRPEGFPKEENLQQIAKHEKSHNEKLEFAFTIVDIDETYCYGCIFVKPIVPFLKFAFFNDRLVNNLELEEVDQAVSFWITPKGHAINLYERLLVELSNWFKEEWPYERFYLLGMGLSEEEIVEIEKLNLYQKFLFQIEETKYIMWRLF